MLGAGCVTGCQVPDQTAFITATLVADLGDVSESDDYLLVRAVPDHADGFATARPYQGDRVYADQCPLDHLEFPLEFALVGPGSHLEGAPERWRLLAWITDDPSATWVGPGELYGTVAFRFDHDPYWGPVAEGITFELTDVGAQ